MGAIFLDMSTRTIARESLNRSAPYQQQHNLKVSDWRQWKNIKSHEVLSV